MIISISFSYSLLIVKEFIIITKSIDKLNLQAYIKAKIKSLKSLYSNELMVQSTSWDK